MKAEWQLTTVGAVAHVGAGNSAPQDKALFADGKHPFFRTSDAGRVRFGDIEESTDYLNDEGIKGLRRFPVGTILFPKSGASTFLNHRVILGVAGYVSSHLGTIVGDEAKVNQRFLLYFLSTISAQDLIQDHAYPSLNLPLIGGIPIAIPSLSEQQRIVAILDDVFDGIATAKGHAEQNLQNARELFVSQREALLSSKNKWNEAPLTELCDIKHGYAFEGEYFSSKGDYVLLTPGSFFETGGYRERGEKTKYFVGPIPPAYILERGDVLVAMTEQAAGLLGSPLLVPESNRFLHNQRLGLVIGKQGVPWLNEFFFHVFNLVRVRQEIHSSASGVKVRHTSPGRIGAVRVKYPASIEEQRSVAAELDELLKHCERLGDLYKSKIVALDGLKRNLLQRAFNGDL